MALSATPMPVKNQRCQPEAPVRNENAAPVLWATSIFLRPLVRSVIEEFLEAEMAAAIGAEKGERVEGRLGYRSGYYPRSLITRVRQA